MIVLLSWLAGERATKEYVWIPIFVTSELHHGCVGSYLRQGDRLIYDFVQHRSIKVAASASITSLTPSAVPASVDITVKQTGEFIVNVYSDDAQGWTVGLQLLGVQIEESTGTPTDNLSEEMGVEIIALVSQSGKISKLVASDKISPEARNHWRDILSRWQVILPDDVQKATWTQTEEDSTGTYVAKYNRVSLGSEYHIVKQKDHYRAIASVGQNGNFSAKHSVQGQSSIRMAPY